MCDNMDDALLGDEGGIDGDYDIRAEDEEALLEEDNFDDQNLVSSSNRNYYGTREELEEEELDHEPEEPEDIMESDENVSDLPDEDANDSFNKSANSREKRDTKFVSERNVPSTFDNSQMGSNKYMNPIGRPQQQNFNRNSNCTMNRGVRGGRFRGRGRGNLGNRPEAVKKVLINPHFAGNVQFNNQVRLPWHNNANTGNTAGRIQPWNQDRMPPPQRMPQNEPFQRQIHVPNKQFIQQQQQMDPDHMMTHQQYQKPPVHQRLGNQPHHNLNQNIDSPQPFIDHRPPINPQPNYPPPHVYQSPPSNNQQPPPQSQQILYHQPLAQYNQPPPLVNQQTFAVGPNQSQASYSMSIPPPQMPVFTQQGGQQFSSPPPGYLAPSGGYDQGQGGVFVPPQQHMGGFEFQPPPQGQMQPHEVQQFQQQIVYQQQMPPPNYHPQHEPSVQYNPNTLQYVQNIPQNNPQIQQERRVFAPRPTAQNRLGPPNKNQQQQQQDGRFVVNSMKRGGRNVNRGGAYVNRGALMVSPGKRRYQAMEGGTDQRRRRTAEVANLHEVPTVDSTTTVLSRIAPAVVKKHAEIEEDEETRLYRQKIENQKKIREKILAQKEERRKQAAMRTAAEKGLANLTPPSEIVAKLIPEKQSPIKTIISQNPHPILIKRRILKTTTNTSVNLNNRIVSQPSKFADQSPTTTNKDEISSFLTNRRIIAKDQSLANTSIVIVSNLAAGTSEVKLRKLCQGVGDVQKLEMRPSERQATIQFKSIASAHAFFKKYQRYMIDLSMINVVLKT